MEGHPRFSPQQVRRFWSWGIGAALMLVIVAVLAAGYYQEFYRPPRVWAGKVNDVQFTMGDLVERMRIEQGLRGTVDLAEGPFDYLQRLLRAEVRRPRAGSKEIPPISP